MNRDVAGYWEREMRDRLELKNQRIAELERKVALLEAFVDTSDDITFVFPVKSRDDGERYHAARAALDWIPK